jgi:cell division protein FtsB
MAKTYKNGAEILAERAQEPNPTARADAEARVRTRISQDPAPSRRMIYSGTMPVPAQADASTGVSLPPRNRKITRRRVSPFNIILLLMGLAAAIVLYIGNIIAVDQLVGDIHKQEIKLQVILNEQEMLRARINQMSSLERIRKRAEEELGLQNPSAAPNWLHIDPEKAREIEEALPKR